MPTPPVIYIIIRFLGSENISLTAFI